MNLGSRDTGLCERCCNVRVVESRTGSRFYLCRLSTFDPSLRKYPAIPVLHCRGYKAAAQPSAAAAGADRGR